MARWSVDDLAAATGTTVRTVRFYAAEGLLPAPAREGRTAWYDAGHRVRLELIHRLQDHGYTLAAIRRVLESIPADATPEEFAVRGSLLTPWAPVTHHDELTTRDGQPFTAEQVAFLEDVGLVRRLPDGRHQSTPSQLAVGQELLDLPLPLPALRAAAAVLTRHTDALAAELTEVFRAGIWQPLRDGQLAIDPALLPETVNRLRAVAVQGLVAAFEHAADRVLNEDGR
ncbi:MerR family transcriptional regulator [Actinoplanes sp. NPDC049265]|uniref:MerR family transcriptional regulator n=1 Tax=Actinoplanes sp. NPDC049265 TaxID=3363902 RepID=UPI0037149E82